MALKGRPCLTPPNQMGGLNAHGNASTWHTQFDNQTDTKCYYPISNEPCFHTYTLNMFPDATENVNYEVGNRTISDCEEMNGGTWKPGPQGARLVP
eukprot:gene46416-57879_t